MICQCCTTPLDEMSVYTRSINRSVGPKIRHYVRHLLKLQVLRILVGKGKGITQWSAHPASL